MGPTARVSEGQPGLLTQFLQQLLDLSEHDVVVLFDFVLSNDTGTRSRDLSLHLIRSGDANCAGACTINRALITMYD